MLNYILIVYFFIIGTIFGSFLNMLVYRVNSGQDLLGRSFCDKTKKQLEPIDLIPIFSYFLFKGRCRDCGAKLSILYPIVEFFTGILSVCAFLLVYPLSDSYDFAIIILNWSIIFVIIFIFIFYAYYDFLYWEVDVRSLYFSGGTLIFLNIINAILFYFYKTSLPFFGDPLQHLLGGLVLAGIIWIVFKITKGGGMGEGDIYLFGLSGLALGLVPGFFAFILTSIYGSVFGLIKAARIGKLHGVRVQLAPFIALGTLTMLFFKDFIIKIFFGPFF